jgi:hypothetical protein
MINVTPPAWKPAAAPRQTLRAASGSHRRANIWMMALLCPSVSPISLFPSKLSRSEPFCRPERAAQVVDDFAFGPSRRRRYLYRPLLEMPAMVQISASERLRSSYRWYRSSCFLGFSFGGWPPLQPRARVAARPAWVRSRMSLRSNWGHRSNGTKLTTAPCVGRR